MDEVVDRNLCITTDDEKRERKKRRGKEGKEEEDQGREEDRPGSVVHQVLHLLYVCCRYGLSLEVGSWCCLSHPHSSLAPAHLTWGLVLWCLTMTLAGGALRRVVLVGRGVVWDDV